MPSAFNPSFTAVQQYEKKKKCFCKSCWSFNAIKYKVSNVFNLLEFGKEITDDTFPSFRNLSFGMYINPFDDFSHFVAAFAEQSELFCRTSTALSTSKLVGHIGGSSSTSSASSVSPSSKGSLLVLPRYQYQQVCLHCQSTLHRYLTNKLHSTPGKLLREVFRENLQW